MKQCPYCGKEYSDELSLCPIDQRPLEGVGVPPVIEAVQETNAATPAPGVGEEKVYVVYPEYQWSARDAWKFLGMVVVLGVLWDLIFRAFYQVAPSFSRGHWGPVVYLVMAIFYVAIHLVTAAYFGRTESVRIFCKAVSLDRKPSDDAWFGVVVALGLVIFGHILHALGWAKSYERYDLAAFHETHVPARVLYLFPLLLAPFWEEMVNRGFLYTAFRGSYSVPLTTGLMVAYTAFTHWNQYYHLGWAMISLSALAVLQCYVRERSDSLWDCILLHFVYNGAGLLVADVLR